MCVYIYTNGTPTTVNQPSSLGDISSNILIQPFSLKPIMILCLPSRFFRSMFIPKPEIETLQFLLISGNFLPNTKDNPFQEINKYIYIYTYVHTTCKYYIIYLWGNFSSSKHRVADKTIYSQWTWLKWVVPYPL